MFKIIWAHKTLRLWLVGIVLVSTITSVFFLRHVTFSDSPGTSEKIGRIMKVGYRGRIWRTWEIEVATGGISDGSGTLGGDVSTYTIYDTDLVDIAKKYKDERAQVNIVYHVPYFYLDLNSRTGKFTESIKPTK